jgi:protein TonB
MHVLLGRGAAGAHEALPRRRRPRTARVLRASRGESEARDPAPLPAPPWRRAGRETPGRPRIAFLAASLALHLALLVWARAETSVQAPRTVPIPIAWLDAQDSPGTRAPDAPRAEAPDPVAPPPAPEPRARRAAAAPRARAVPAELDPAPRDAGLPSAAPGPGASAPGSAGAGDGAPVDAAGPLAGPAVALPRGGYQVRPAYPARARTAGVEGTTRLRVLVTPRGRVAEARVDESAGDADLDRAALGAVLRWRFEPLTLPPEAPGLWVIVPIHFRLSEER